MGDENFGTLPRQLIKDPLNIEALSARMALKSAGFDERGDTDGIIMLAGDQNEAHQIAERVGHGDYLGHPTGNGTADGLALGPSFAP